MEIPDDGENGGEVAERLVWEAYEEAFGMARQRRQQS